MSLGWHYHEIRIAARTLLSQGRDRRAVRRHHAGRASCEAAETEEKIETEGEKEGLIRSQNKKLNERAWANVESEIGLPSLSWLVSALLQPVSLQRLLYGFQSS